jgi:hypothetical protein
MIVPLSGCFTIQPAECNGPEDILAGTTDAIGVRKCSGKVTPTRFEQPLLILLGKESNFEGKGEASSAWALMFPIEMRGGAPFLFRSEADAGQH